MEDQAGFGRKEKLCKYLQFRKESRSSCQASRVIDRSYFQNECSQFALSLAKANESLLDEGNRDTLNKALSMQVCWDIMTWAIVSTTKKESSMAFKPNYRLERADRNRAARARSEEKQKKKDEKAAQRKAEPTVEIESPPDDEKA